MKECPWGWIRKNSKALLPFPGAVTGFCPVLEGEAVTPHAGITLRDFG